MRSKLVIVTSIGLITVAIVAMAYWILIRQDGPPRFAQPTTSIIQPSPTITPITPTLGVTNKVTQYPSGKIIKLCSWPWDEDIDFPGEHLEECLEFDAEGNITRTIQGLGSPAPTTIGSNKDLSVDERAKIATEVRVIYGELRKESTIEWTKRTRLPVIGTVSSPHINVYTIDSTGKQDTIEYNLGLEGYTDTSSQIHIIYDKLSSYTTLTGSKQ